MKQTQNIQKLSCEDRAKRKIQLDAAQEELRVSDETAAAAKAASDLEEVGAAKRRVEAVLVEILGPDGHVGRCRIPTAVVVQLGLFRVLLGSDTRSTVSDVTDKIDPNSTLNFYGGKGTDMVAQNSDSANWDIHQASDMYSN